MPLRTIIFIILAAFGYMLSPVDLLPDAALPGIGFADDLAVFLALCWFLFTYLPAQRREQAEEPQGGPAGAQAEREANGADEFGARFASRDPYVVLGVERTASADDIRRAYRALLTQYHPDKVAHLSPEFRDLAHKRAVAILAAYGELGGN